MCIIVANNAAQLARIGEPDMPQLRERRRYREPLKNSKSELRKPKCLNPRPSKERSDESQQGFWVYC